MLLVSCWQKNLSNQILIHKRLENGVNTRKQTTASIVLPELGKAVTICVNGTIYQMILMRILFSCYLLSYDANKE